MSLPEYKGFSMPPWYGTIKDIPTASLQEYEEKESVRKAWSPLITSILDHYSSEVLPKGTLLYHGSLYNPLKTRRKNANLFFGTDVLIALWYLQESKMHAEQSLDRLIKMLRNDPNPDPSDLKDLKNLTLAVENSIGYLYVFETKKPILGKLLNFDDENPNENAKCTNPPPVCIHPQGAYRAYPETKWVNQINYETGGKTKFKSMGVDLKYAEMSTEVYMSMKDIKLKETYTVDINKLIRNRKKDVYQWNPVNSIEVSVPERKAKTSSCEIM
jgi:hypothetical protein